MSAMRARSSSSLREGGSCSFGASVDWEDVARGGAMLCPIAFCHSRRSTAGAPALMSVREGGVLGDGVRNRATSVIHLSFSQATHASITVATRDGAEIAKFKHWPRRRWLQCRFHRTRSAPGGDGGQVAGTAGGGGLGSGIYGLYRLHQRDWSSGVIFVRQLPANHAIQAKQFHIIVIQAELFKHVFDRLLFKVNRVSDQDLPLQSQAMSGEAHVELLLAKIVKDCSQLLANLIHTLRVREPLESLRQVALGADLGKESILVLDLDVGLANSLVVHLKRDNGGRGRIHEFGQIRLYRFYQVVMQLPGFRHLWGGLVCCGRRLG